MALVVFKKPKRKLKREEATLQEQLAEILPAILPANVAWFAVPNGGSRNFLEAINLKKQGLRAGVPDLIFIAGGKSYGLELKSQKGVLNENQKITFPYLRNAGMRIEVARSYPEAIEMLKQMGIQLRAKAA